MPEAISPRNRPQISPQKAREILTQHGVAAKVAILGVRGYYLRSMGDPTKNDRGVYDDALVVVCPDGVWAYNANTDPSIHRPGIAKLRPGVHPYKRGNHGISRPGGGYPAFRPATKGEELPVDRDGETNPRPGVAINIHRGSLTTTSSEGCQTIHPSQWAEFQKKVYSLMDKYGQTVIPYCLVENKGEIA